MPGKYDHINFKPPASVASAAARGLELRKKNKGKGGLSSGQAKKSGVGSGVQRAVNLKNRDTMSPGTVRRMKAFFDRHQKNRKASGGKPLAEDKGYIAWMLWGGDPGYSWAKKIVRQMEAADKKGKKKKASLLRLAKDKKHIPADRLTTDSEDYIPHQDFLHGGEGDDSFPGDFDPEQLAKGIKVELEHTGNPMIAREIALDHLTEHPRYYDYLEEMEEELERDLENDAADGIAALAELAQELDYDGQLDFADKIDELIREAGKRSVPTNKALWGKAQAAAKKKFKVHPSAYSNAWAAKWYKKKGGGWKTESSLKETNIRLASKKKMKGGLGEWFREEWVDISHKDKSGRHPPCGRPKAKSKAYPKCRPKSKAKQMSSSEKRKATEQKRQNERKSPKKGKGNKPTHDSHTKRD